jgi:hypothetical protein
MIVNIIQDLLYTFESSSVFSAQIHSFNCLMNFTSHTTPTTLTHTCPSIHMSELGLLVAVAGEVGADSVLGRGVDKALQADLVHPLGDPVGL